MVLYVFYFTPFCVMVSLMMSGLSGGGVDFIFFKISKSRLRVRNIIDDYAYKQSLLLGELVGAPKKERITNGSPQSLPSEARELNDKTKLVDMCSNEYEHEPLQSLQSDPILGVF